MTRTPSGHLLPSEAIDKIGRWKFQGEWTGREHEANPSMLPPGTTPARGGGALGGGRRYTVRAAAAPRLSHEEWIKANAAPTTPEYCAAYEANKAAIERWEKARDELHQRMEDGEVTAAKLLEDGRLKAIPAHEWRVRSLRTRTLGEYIFIREFGLAQPSDARAMPHRPPIQRESAAAALVELYPPHGDPGAEKLESVLNAVNSRLSGAGNAAISRDTLRRAIKKNRQALGA